MIEAWSAWVCSAEFLTAWSIIAVAVFCFLFWFPAPYGRHTKVGWGPLISAQLGWIGMEAVTLVGFGLCFFARPDYSPAGLLFVLLYGGHYLYRSFTVETFGAFGEEAWKLVTQCCGRDHPHASDDACMWRRPDPKKDFVLAVGFAIQRGCANTLLRAASRRKSRRSSSPVDPALFNPRGEIDA